jgi:hypothetical protein
MLATWLLGSPFCQFQRLLSAREAAYFKIGFAPDIEGPGEGCALKVSGYDLQVSTMEDMTR